MKLFVLLNIAILIAATTHAESYIPNSPDPYKPGHCFHKELQRPIQLNESVKPINVELCAELTCQEEGLIRLSQCPRVQPSCKNFQYQPTDFSKPYPECCERYKCNK